MIKSNHTKTAILVELLNHSPHLVSSSDLNSRTETSRQSIWKAVDSLRNEGFGIQAIPKRGYKLTSLPDHDLSASYVSALTYTACSRYQDIIFFESVDTTQAEAKKLARSGALPGTTVVADKQTEGRGRIDRKWISPSGGLYFSIISKPDIRPSRIQLVNLLAGLAVKKAIITTTGIGCYLKWPNDILYKDLKICGILSEALLETDMVHFVVTGIGMNVNNSISNVGAHKNFKAITLKEITGKSFNRSVLLSSILCNFYELLSDFERRGPKALIQEYRQHCSTIGKKITVITKEGSYPGIAENIGEEGELVLLNERGELMSFHAGDVIHAPLPVDY